MTNGTPAIAKFGDYKRQLFDLYTRLRYNELICHTLMSGAVKIERAVRLSIVGLLAISLLTGSTSYLNPPVLSPVWAVASALATLLAAYSLIVGSNSKQFTWFALASKFHAVANEVEFFSEYVKLGKITEDELLEAWREFSDSLADLITQGGVDLREYAEKNGEALREKLATILKQENKGS